MTELSALGRIQMFVIRARRIEAHSVARDPFQLPKFASGHFDLEFDDDDGTTVRRDLPDEEIFESFAARVRPLTLEYEPIRLNYVLDAIHEVISASDNPELATTLDVLRAKWDRLSSRPAFGDADYYVQRLDPETGEVNDTISDDLLGDSWFYLDVAHATAKGAKRQGESYELATRYIAGVKRWADWGVLTIAMLNFIRELHERDVIELSEYARTVAVKVEPSDLVVKNVRAFLAPVGTPAPNNLPIGAGEMPPAWEELTAESATVLTEPLSVDAILFDEHDAPTATLRAVESHSDGAETGNVMQFYVEELLLFEITFADSSCSTIESVRIHAADDSSRRERARSLLAQILASHYVEFTGGDHPPVRIIFNR